MANKYYLKHKGRLCKEASERYQNLSEEKKNKRQKKALERYKNLTQVEKEKKA